MPEKELLIIDDNHSTSELVDFLRKKRYLTAVVETYQKALYNINESSVSVVVLNVERSDEDGLEMLQKIKTANPDVLVNIIGARLLTKIKAIQLGATPPVLSTSAGIKDIHEAVHQSFRRLANRTAAADLPDANEEFKIVGKSKAIETLIDEVALASNSDNRVLLEGETGVGKGLVARVIHDESSRKKKPFIVVDCGALTESLREPELLGYEKGAYTDAKTDKPGKFELADGGTLFLDEIGNMSPAAQETLLAVLDSGEVTRVGGTKAIKVDVRIISATNKNLWDMVKEKAFREDLYFRLYQRKITVPPLRKRKEDISLLVSYFLHLIEEESEKPMYGVSKEALKVFRNFEWPGNVRELKSYVETAFDNARGEVILVEDLPKEVRNYTENGGRENTEQDAPQPQEPENRDTSAEFTETGEIPPYQHLRELPIAAFCRFISDNAAEGTDSQLSEWWTELSDDGRRRANKAKHEMDQLLLKFRTEEYSLTDFAKDIGDTIDAAISGLSEYQERTGAGPKTEPAPVSIIGKTYKGSLKAVLQEVVKAHSGDTEKAGITLKQMSTQKLNEWLSDGTPETELQTPIPPSRKVKKLSDTDIERLFKESIDHFIGIVLPDIGLENKALEDQVSTVHLALKVLSKRLAGEYGYIYFGDITFKQIERHIYRRVRYLYQTGTEAASALKKDSRTIKQHWTESELRSHRVLFSD